MTIILANNVIVSLKDGFKALIVKLISFYLSEDFKWEINEYKAHNLPLLEVWKIPGIIVNMNAVSEKDFNQVVQALEKGRKYLDTLITEEAQKQFAEDYIDTSVFNDLKYYVDETLRHFYKDPRYETKTNKNSN